MIAKSQNKPKNEPDADAQKNRALGAISYFWIFFIIPLVGKKGSPFAQFHAKQGAVVALTWFCLWLLAFIPIINIVIVFPGMILLAVANILAIIRAWHGERWQIPFLYKYVRVMNL